MSHSILKEPKTGREVLNFYFKNSLNTNAPVALWKLPESSVQHLATDLGNPKSPEVFSIENSAPGFIVSPFNDSGNGKYFFIQADRYYNTAMDTDLPELENETDKITMYPDTMVPEEEHHMLSLSDEEISSDDRDHYKSMVGYAIEKIKANALKKVVLARRKEIKLERDIDPMQVFNALCDDNKPAFVSLIFHPAFGCWVGASPELLASVDEDNIFRTVALAGTQKISPSMPLSDLSWNQKEIEEQALVNRYIIGCFKAIRLREYEEDGPRTVAAGNLAHLRTDFSVDMKKLALPGLGSTMLELLHPTSAVCGMPKESAMDFISNHERFDRKLYAGFIGPVNINNQSQAFVNIRCARLYRNSAFLFAGAGITKDSVPEQEWRETELKIKMIEASLF